RLGGCELVVAQDALRLQVGETLQLGRQVIAAGRRSGRRSGRRRCVLRLRLLLLVHLRLVRLLILGVVLLLLVMTHRTGSARNHRGRRRGPHQSASSSNHVRVLLEWLRAGQAMSSLTTSRGMWIEPIHCPPEPATASANGLAHTCSTT